MTKREELRLLGDHLQRNVRRNHGAQGGGLVRCSVHGEHYPSTESCPWGEGVHGPCRRLSDPMPPVVVAEPDDYAAELSLEDYYWV
jgi:hypothetical protein